MLQRYLGTRKVNDWVHQILGILQEWGPLHCGDTHIIYKDSFNSSLVPGSQEIFFFSVLSDPDSASDSDMHVFSVDFMHLLERKVADSWALTEGKHHPVGLTLCPVWSTWLLAFSQVFAPYMHLSSITVMVIVSWPVAFYLIHLEQEGMSCGWNLALSFQLWI